MKLFTLLCFLIILTITFSSGCTRSISTPSSENQTIPTQTTTFPTLTSSSIITASTTIANVPTVTITLGPLKTIKDSQLWFTMQVPENWVVTTEQLSIPAGYRGLGYDTSLYGNNEFHIFTYGITRAQDQDLRNYYRSYWMRPNESTVTLNGITFDRFESKSDGNISVAYSVRKGSGNERGFASVIEYSINSNSEYQQKDFESIISTFRYVSAHDIGSAPGEEIKRLE